MTNRLDKPTIPTDRCLLVVDDDRELCDLLSEYLRPEGFQVEAVHCGDAAVELALSGKFELVVLDVMLPGINGYEVLRRIRARSFIPVIMLTARGQDVDRILGLEIGADDYVPKPFNPRELLARALAVLRRSVPGPANQNPAIPEHLQVDDISLDQGSRAVRCGNRDVELTSVEFKLLAMFLKAPTKVLKREDLVRAVLDRELYPFDRSIDVHVSNLRKKLGPASDGRDRIKNVRSAGYVLVRSTVM